MTAYIINLKMSIKLTVVYIILPNSVINLYVKMMNLLTYLLPIMPVWLCEQLLS